MEVLIHGTKGGYRILYKTPGAPSIGIDIRNNVSSEAALGQSAYSIAFAANGCVFTKYIIIRDTLRSDATGFIAFSLFLFINKELEHGGADVKAILDDLCNQYVAKYVRNNNINKGESDIIQEDWAFVENILVEKSEQNRSHFDAEIQQGTKEAALLFFKDDLELQEYFSKPFQAEYNGYKQVLLIKSELQNRSADLLKALRNSGDKIEVDLKNEPFFLSNYGHGRGLSITSSGQPRSDRKNQNVIRAKELVEIKYTEEYHEPILETGKLSIPGSDIFKYFEILGNQITINWHKLSSDLRPIEKTLTFSLRDWKGNPVSDAVITCTNNNNESKTIDNSTATFRGFEFGKRWTCSAKNDRFSSDIRPIYFDKDCPGDHGIIDIVLDKHTLTITAHEGTVDGDILVNASVSKTEFFNREIEETHRITVSCRGFETNFFDYCPASDANPHHIPLQKMQPAYGGTNKYSYSVNAGKHGTLEGGKDYLSNTKDGSDVKSIITPNKGYEFTHFRQEGGALVAQYEKKKYFFKNESFIAAIMVTILFVVVGLLYFLGENDWSIKRLLSKFRQAQEEVNKTNIQHIEAYIKGDSLILRTLDSYNNSLSGQQMHIKHSLDSAIMKRIFANEFNIAELKKLSYYPSQEQFRMAIFKMDSTEGYKQVKNRFADVSSWSLTKIADSINAFLDHKPAADNPREVKKEVTNEEKEESRKEGTQPARPEQIREEELIPPPANSDKATEIIRYLRGEELKKDVLNKYFEDTRSNVALKKSIQLCLKFWELDGSRNKSFSSFQREINDDAILNSSMLRNFVDDVCRKGQPQYPKEVEGVPAGITNTLQKLKSKIRK
jgi:hypothetical protein